MGQEKWMNSRNCKAWSGGILRMYVQDMMILKTGDLKQCLEES